MKNEFIITPEQSYAFTAKHYTPEPKKNIYCSHDARSHHVLIPAVPAHENDYYPGLVKYCITCNREVESDMLMKDVIPDDQKAYVNSGKDKSKLPYQISPRSKINPPSYKKHTSVYVKSPFIF